MIKILVVSDCHGNRDIINKILLKEEETTHIFIDCGDSLIGDGNPFPFSTVKGNCDIFTKLPKHITLETPLGVIYVTHGEMGLSNLSRMILQLNPKPDILLYGHTHMHRYDYINGCHCFNPGSVALPRDGTNGTYLVIEGTNKNNLTWGFKEITN